ncbi:MAG: NfeD family protein [Acidimicrobiales bacterium]
MSDALWWLLATVALLGAELFTRAFFAVFVAIGALVAALVATSGAPVLLQGIALIGASAIGILAARPPLRRAMSRGHHRLISGAQGLVGKEAVVTARLGGINAPGKIRAQGELWTAYSDDGKPVEEGRVVMILDLDGSRYVVHEVPGP